MDIQNSHLSFIVGSLPCSRVWPCHAMLPRDEEVLHEETKHGCEGDVIPVVGRKLKPVGA